MLQLNSWTQSGRDTLISIPIDKYRLMSKCPIMLDGCNQRYELGRELLRLERLQHRDTVEIMTNDIKVVTNERDEWKQKARRRVVIFSGIGVIIGFIIGLIT